MAEHLRLPVASAQSKEWNAIVVLCVACCLFNLPVSAQPLPVEAAQWKQSVERPTQGWDYDGQRILGHDDKTILLWDATTGKLLHTLKGHQERIQKVQFSPDGQHALSSSWRGPGPMVMAISRDTRTILWDLATGQVRQSFPGQVAGEYSPDGKRIVCFSQRPGTGIANPDWGVATKSSTGETWQLGTEAKFDAAVWDVATGRELVKVKLDDDSGIKWDALHFSPAGRRVVYVANGAFLLYNSSRAVLYNGSDGRELGRVAAKHGIHRYTANGALACFDAERISLQDIESGRSLQSFAHGKEMGWLGAWTHDGRQVAAFPRDGTIHIWDTETGKLTSGTKSGRSPQRAAISPNNSRLVVQWSGGHVAGRYLDPGTGLYDMKTGEEVTRLTPAQSGAIIGFSPDSKTLLIGGSGMGIYNAENGQVIRTIKLLDETGVEYKWNQ